MGRVIEKCKEVLPYNNVPVPRDYDIGGRSFGIIWSRPVFQEIGPGEMGKDVGIPLEHCLRRLIVRPSSPAPSGSSDPHCVSDRIAHSFDFWGLNPPALTPPPRLLADSFRRVFFAALDIRTLVRFFMS